MSRRVLPKENITMRKDLERRLLAVATILDHSQGTEKTALDDNKSLWKKFFGPKPAAQPAAPAATPSSTLEDLDQKADRGFTPEKDDRGLFKKKAPPPPPKTPQPLEEKVPGTREDIQSFADFINGTGGVPLELSNPLKQISQALAASGAASLKDAQSIAIYLAKTLRKYLAGQKLAKVEAMAKHAEARKTRLGVKTAGVVKTAILSNLHKVSNDGGYHYVLESGKSPKDVESWDTVTGKVSGLYRGNVNIDGAQCVMFQGDDGKMYAVLRQNARIEEPAAVDKHATLDYTAELKSFLSVQK